MVERLHHHLKEVICARDGGFTWLDHLLRVRLGIRAALKKRQGSFVGGSHEYGPAGIVWADPCS